jgi:hypothetical protein
MELIDTRILRQRQHQTFAMGHVELTESFDNQRGHESSPMVKRQQRHGIVSRYIRGAFSDNDQG